MAILYPPFRIMNERMARIQKKIRIPLFSKKKKKKRKIICSYHSFIVINKNVKREKRKK